MALILIHCLVMSPFLTLECQFSIAGHSKCGTSATQASQYVQLHMHLFDHQSTKLPVHNLAFLCYLCRSMHAMLAVNMSH